MSDWKQIGRRFKSFKGFLSALLALIPLPVGLIDPALCPAWPDGTPIIAPGICAVLIVVSVVYFVNRAADEVRSGAKWLLVSALFSALLYLFLLSLLVVDLGGTRRLRGLSLSQEADRYIHLKNVAPNDYANLFGHFGHDSANRIWSDFYFERFAFAAVFFWASGGLAAGVALLVLEDYRRDTPTQQALGA